MQSVPDIFEALITQTLQRGGSPSANTISHAAICCDNIIECWKEVREHAVFAGMSVSLSEAIEAMDSAVKAYEGAIT